MLHPKVTLSLCVAFALCCCSPVQQSFGFSEKLKEAVIKGLQQISCVPVVRESGTINYLIDTALIFEFNEYRLYLLPYQLEQSVNRELKSVTRELSYFFFRKGDSCGRFFKNLTYILSVPQTFRVDSMQKDRLGAPNFDGVLDRMTHESTTHQGKITKEVFSIRNTWGVNNMDSVYLFLSDDLKSMDYSLGRRIDSIRNKKIFRAVLHFNEAYSAEFDAHFPKREAVVELAPVEFIPKDVKEFFSKLILTP